ncbi:tetratricopeptide repeat protein 39B-like isoform X2 [Coccinella septempunctata]|nr:tetratricopeptide repeat protein 39B-like isoform X2 [Coccinella septempunctata]XP_044766073.1 tetratricopeptide repeat protein 39B-like isoform X2 [Coccinella septempunctata]XP_044766074.1 tetratricopeptide repeat protein 39B-like isoform X2 [Coccinella septempunctata]
MTSHSDDDDQEVDIDEFQDACDTSDISTLPEHMTLDRAMEEAQKAIEYFFNNQFTEARNMMVPYANSSMYHALGNSVFLYLEALLTFDPQNIQAASKALKDSIRVCNRFRKKNTLGESLGKMVVRKNNFDQFTEEEAHAELCYAECLLLKSMLTFIEDETLASFIKAGFKIRSCYNCYKDCQQILFKRDWNSSTTKHHFEGGVMMGIGTFNLMISMLPARIIKLLEFIGFSGNKQLGLDHLQKGYHLEGIRQILCIMTLLGYNLMVLYIVSHSEGDLKICEEILKKQLGKHPNGVWFLFFKGRMEFMRGNLDQAKEWYLKSWRSQNTWPQFHHVCFWELLWLESVRCNWKEALEYSNRLTKESKWSRTIYSYQKAAIMLMMDNISSSDKEIINSLMKDVPKYKQRIAGKSIPMEKFVIKKSERYFNQKQHLILPVFELMYLWNLFKVFKQFNLTDQVYKLLEKTLATLNSSTLKSKYDMDNRALILLLQGAVLRRMQSPLQALECLENAIALQKDIVDDTYLIPYAIVELALIEWDLGNKEKAVLALEDARKNYTGYSMESRLHFRIHTALTEFKPELKNFQDTHL